MSQSKFTPKNYAWTPSQDALIINMWNAGREIPEIVAALADPGISLHMLKYRKEALGLPKRYAERFEWTEKKIEALRLLWKDPELTMTAIMKEIGCSRHNLAVIVDRLGLPDRRKKAAWISSQPKAPPAVFASGPIPLPQRKSATAPPDIKAWQRRQRESRERLEADGGYLRRWRDFLDSNDPNKDMAE